jgi:hypothetical protein
MTFRPRFLGPREAAPVPQPKLREAVTRAAHIGPDVLPAPEEITGGFFLLRENVNRREHARPIQDGELAGIAAIRLNAIAGAARDQGWSNDVARNLAGGEKALSLEATRARFLTAADGLPVADARRNDRSS